MRYWMLCLGLLFLVISTTQAQRYLQMERSGTHKVKRYSPGDEVTFRLGDDPTWYTEEIREIMVNENLIVFTNRAVRVEEISYIRRFNGRRWSKPVGQQLYNFGLGWLLFSLGDALVGGDLTNLAFIVPAVAGATGFLIQKIFRQRTFKMKGKRRLRLLDLSFSSFPGP